jgi:hypothetical protein
VRLNVNVNLKQGGTNGSKEESCKEEGSKEEGSKEEGSKEEGSKEESCKEEGCKEESNEEKEISLKRSSFCKTPWFPVLYQNNKNHGVFYLFFRRGFEKSFK